MTVDPNLLTIEADQAAAAGDIRLARRLLEQIAVANPEHPQIWLKLAAMHRAAGDVDRAMSAVHRALAAAPLDFTALLLRASLLERRGDPSADEAYGRALAQRPEGDLPPTVAAALAHAERRHEVHLVKRAAILGEAVAPTLLTSGEKARINRFHSNSLRRTVPFHSEPTHFHYPGLVEREFHDRSDFPWLTELEAATDAIAAEFEILAAANDTESAPYIQYADHEPVNQWRALNHSRDWTAIHLFRNGETVTDNIRQCPRTMAVLSRIPQPWIAGCSANAMFSLLSPGTTIPPHTGVSNTRLVCHLPLIVPQGCWFRVGAETREWTRGDAFVFDDTIEHEAANPTALPRVVLILDVWHPGLSEAEREAVRLSMEAEVRMSGSIS